MCECERVEAGCVCVWMCVCVSPNIVDKETNGSSDFVCLSYITQREGIEIGGKFIVIKCFIEF